MLSRIKQRLKRGEAEPIDENGINYTKEHVRLARTIARRRKAINAFWAKLHWIRAALAGVGILWLLALPYEALWKRTYIDEHAIQPGQVTLYYDWANVHSADLYLNSLETLSQQNATQKERSDYLQESFSAAGLRTGNTSTSTWAHVTPPRSAGTEVILITANWLSKEGGLNLRGVAMLLSLGEFLRGQNHWAFDFVLVVGEGYVEGLEGFMQEYYDLFPGLIWTGLNLDYPGHSFDHIGLFYEGVNGRLPNQDLVNSVAHISKWTGGVPVRIHDVQESPIPSGNYLQPHLGNYLLAAKHMWEHAQYMALGRASGAHGVLAKHRIDALTIFCPHATGPHGFHSLGRTVESSLRSLNNLLERLHASYFFYLLPRPDKFIPVGNYLPSVILLGASVTLNGFDIPTPVQGILWLVPPFLIAILGWIIQSPLVSFIGIVLPKPKGTAKRSASGMAHLLFGAIIPTLGMVNFPQAVMLALLTVTFLFPWKPARILAMAIHPYLLTRVGIDLRWEWEVLGNLTWVMVYAIWVPLSVIAAMI